MKKRMIIGAMAIIMAACTPAVSAETLIISGTPQITDVYGTSTTADVKWDILKPGSGEYNVYIYDPVTGELEKYKTVSGTSCEITGLEPDTKYRIRVAHRSEKNGKHFAIEFDETEFTTQEAFDSSVCNVNTEYFGIITLDPSVQIPTDLRVKYGNAAIDEDKAYHVAHSSCGDDMYVYTAGKFDSNYYIVHDGIVESYNFLLTDENAKCPARHYCTDIDNDGEEEFVTLIKEESWCLADTIVIYDKKENGRYTAHKLNDYHLVDIFESMLTFGTVDILEIVETPSGDLGLEIEGYEISCKLKGSDEQFVYSGKVEDHFKKIYDPGDEYISVTYIPDDLWEVNIDDSGNLSVLWSTYIYSLYEDDYIKTPYIKTNLIFNGDRLTIGDSEFATSDQTETPFKRK